MVVEYTSAGQFVLLPVIIYKGEGAYHGWASTIDDAKALWPPVSILSTLTRFLPK